MRLPQWVPSRRVLTIVALVLVVGLGWLTFDHWRPLVRSAWSAIAKSPISEAGDGDDHTPSGTASGGVAVEWIQLTDQARRNIGLKTGEVAVGEYTQTATVPGIVAERPGRTLIRVAAPLTGVITDVFAEPGQSVTPGEVLFILRLNRAEIVEAQSAYLQTLEAIDVENQEIARLEAIRSGVIAEKVVLEHKFARQKLEARGRAERQALLLLGLSEEQVEAIARDRRLLQEFRIVAPTPHDESAEGHLETAHAGGESAENRSLPQLILDELTVHKGDAVAAGAELATLADLSVLYLEGRAFERDAPALARAAEKNWTVSAVPEEGGEAITNLEIAHVENRVDPETRTLVFHAYLPNVILYETSSGDGRRFPTWRFKPGQRMRVRIPVERWEDRIVLPAEAIAQEGPDSYVFVENGPRFDRRSVQIEHLDSEEAVIANDGSLFPGDVVALNAAHQLLMALKNQTVDPSVAAHGHMH